MKEVDVPRERGSHEDRTEDPSLVLEMTSVTGKDAARELAMSRLTIAPSVPSCCNLDTSYCINGRLAPVLRSRHQIDQLRDGRAA